MSAGFASLVEEIAFSGHARLGQFAEVVSIQSSVFAFLDGLEAAIVQNALIRFRAAGYPANHEKHEGELPIHLKS